MPLKKGKGKETHSGNVRELLEKYKSTGKIGNTTPKSAKHARSIANAIAYRKQREG